MNKETSWDRVIRNLKVLSSFSLSSFQIQIIEILRTVTFSQTHMCLLLNVLKEQNSTARIIKFSSLKCHREYGVYFIPKRWKRSKRIQILKFRPKSQLVRPFQDAVIQSNNFPYALFWSPMNTFFQTIYTHAQKFLLCFIMQVNSKVQQRFL